MTIRNISGAMNMQRMLSLNNVARIGSMNRLSSGFRINSAADDAAGLAISMRMRGQIGGLDRASENAQHAVNLLQTADGAMDSTQSLLQRMRELAVQSTNGTLSDADRSFLNQEFTALQSELDRISTSTNFNNIPLLDGSMGGTSGPAGVSEMGVSGITFIGDVQGSARFELTRQGNDFSIAATIGGNTVTAQAAPGDTGVTFDFGGGRTVSLSFDDVSALREGTISGVEFGGAPAAGVTGTPDLSGAVSVSDTAGLTFQIGANGSADQRVNINIGNLSSLGLGVSGQSIGTAQGAENALRAIDSAIDATSSQRANVGSMQNRLESAVSSLGVFRENLTASQSQIRDADMAQEIMNFTRQQMMTESTFAMMAQSANLARSNMMMLLVR